MFEQQSVRREPARFWILFISLAFLFTLVLDSFTAFNRGCRELREDVLRLHVVANSDSEFDQAVKLAVRDGILKETAGSFTGAPDLAQAKAAALENLPRMEAAAASTLSRLGVESPVTVREVRMFFDTRVYEDFTLPAGYYDAVRVEIGAAEGKNWWCVLYPPLCVSAAEERPLIAETFTGEEQAVVTADPEYEVRFWIVEVFGKIKNWLFPGKEG